MGDKATNCGTGGLRYLMRVNLERGIHSAPPTSHRYTGPAPLYTSDKFNNRLAAATP